MPFELGSVLAGGVVGLLGGLGGVVLGHVLSRRRDSITRSIDGLRLVIGELNRSRRLALFFEQQINLSLRERDAHASATKLIELTEWQKATHELMEANWRFPCMAYLPAAQADFEELDHLLSYIMDPYARQPSEEHEMSSEQAWERFKVVVVQIRKKVETRLRQLL